MKPFGGIMKIGLLAGVLALGAVSTFTTLSAWSDNTSPVLVQSIPAETSLAQPDLPHAGDVWAKMFVEAKSSIDLGQFYLSNAPGTELELAIQELEKAGARGVRIRIIVDNAMINNDPATYTRFRQIKNLEMRILNLKNLTGGIIHAKYMVVDQEQVFVGSQNFDWKALSHIHETGVLLRDAKVAAQLTHIFEIDWKICQTGEAPKTEQPLPVEASPVELVASPPQFNPANVRWSLPVLKDLIRGAKKSVRAQVMDYSTSGKGGRWGEIDDELRAAAARGVAVELMVADWSTGAPNIDQLKDLRKVPGVTIKIVTIPRNTGPCITYSRVMHTKMMTIDGETLWVGTSNWSEGYFKNTRGVEMVFRKNAELASQGNRIFETLWVSPYAALIDPDRTYKPPVRDCSAN